MILSKLKRIISKLTPVYKLLRKNLFIPIIEGHLIEMADFKITDKEPLLSKIQAAIKVNGGDLTIRKRLIKKVKKRSEDIKIKSDNARLKRTENNSDQAIY